MNKLVSTKTMPRQTNVKLASKKLRPGEKAKNTRPEAQVKKIRGN